MSSRDLGTSIALHFPFIDREAFALHYFGRFGAVVSNPKAAGIPLPFGRIACRLIARDLLRRGYDKVWMPALICDVLPEAFESEGCKVQYYPVTPEFVPDWSYFKGQIGVGAFLYVNYFGSTHACRRVRQWASDAKLLVIEDNAHGILSELPLDLSPAEYQFTSIGKALGLRYGSFLEVPTESQSFVRSQLSGFSAKIEASTLFSLLPFSWQERVLSRRQVTSAQAPNEGGLKRIPTLRSSWLAALLWRFAPRRKIASVRRETFMMLVDAVQAVPDLAAQQPAWRELMAGTDVPWIFPLRTKAGELMKWKNHFDRAGIETFHWPHLPVGVTSSHPAWRDHYETVLAVPVWRAISGHQLQQVFGEPLA